MINPSASPRPALRYFGGKWNLSPWIIAHFPPHICYVEPFGGGASVLLRKRPAFTEVYNDLNKRAVNFFQVLRDRPAELERALNLTPYSRKEYDLAHTQSPDPLEDARRFAILSGQGNRGAGTVDAGGWRWMKNRSRTSTPAHEWYKTAHLYAIARRFIGVPIESDQATKVIKRYDTPETLFYVDPPYLPETRCMRWTGDAYSHEYTPQQHQDLAQLLHKVKGIVILSGYPSDLYAELYHDWLRTDKIITLRVRSNRGRGRKTTESIWLNPAAAESQRQLRLPFPGL